MAVLKVTLLVPRLGYFWQTRSIDVDVLAPCITSSSVRMASAHDHVIKWKHFPLYWPFVGSPVNSPHKGQWHGALMFSLMCVWINGWVNNREAGDLRRYRAHYDVSVMCRLDSSFLSTRVYLNDLRNLRNDTNRQIYMVLQTNSARTGLILNSKEHCRVGHGKSSSSDISWWPLGLCSWSWWLARKNVSHQNTNLLSTSHWRHSGKATDMVVMRNTALVDHYWDYSTGTLSFIQVTGTHLKTGHQ